MPTLVIPNNILNGTPNDATQVQANFDTIETWALGAIQADGTVPMTARLQLAALDPTVADHATRKSYVDGKVWVAANLAADSVTTPKILDGNVTLGKLAANSVDASKIVDGSVGINEIAANSVDAFRIVDGSVGTAELADGGVTKAKFSSAAGEMLAAWTSMTGSMNTTNVTTPTYSGEYLQIGKTVFISARITAGTVTAGGAIQINLPFTGIAQIQSLSAIIFRGGVLQAPGGCRLDASSNALRIWTETGGNFTAGDSAQVRISGVIQIP